ncbi:sialate O-acetylesterase [Ereboglobus luteus]|uniref:sialate O-acetylesterase n=1 Tax=Ereboglobus luteus TaxID=1796921 RepID=UPI001374B117|nr:sialate O-acetylesterase [Ereboglobus luteus]
MKTPTLLALIAALALAPITPTFAQEANAAELPPDTSLDLFLLIGQSNMAGRGSLTEQDKTAPARVWTLDKDKNWVPAIDPLHFDKPIAGVGLGRTFGIVVSEAQPGVHVGLIPCAVGGTSVNRWKKGGEHYNNAIDRARAAMKHGKLKAILWHQGEGDRAKTSSTVYQQRLRQLIADFRADLKAPDIPFIIGELGRFYKHKTGSSIDDFNEDLRNFAEKERNCICVSSENLAHRGDNVHFNASALRELGRRYAAAYFKLAGITAPAATTASATITTAAPSAPAATAATRSVDLPDGIGSNLALGKTHESSAPNTRGWDSGLTDGIWGSSKGSTYATDASATFPKTVTIDLGKIQRIAHIHTGVPKIGFTKTVEASISEDGEEFKTVGTHDFELGRENRHLYSFEPAEARYVRFTFIENHPKSGKKGYPRAHCFLSEVEVYGPAGSSSK